MTTDPITVGIHEDHNSGVAAVQSGRVVAYCEWERITREKNQAGWFPDRLADTLERLPLDDVGAICAPDTGKVAQFLVDRFEGVTRGDHVVEVAGRPILLFGQDDLHPVFHLFAALTLGDCTPGLYIVLVFDADQPRFTWIDTGKPLTDALLDFRAASSHRWFCGGIFADFFGPLFYGNNSLTNSGKLMGLAEWGSPNADSMAWIADLARESFDDSGYAWQGYLDVEADFVRSRALQRWAIDPHNHEPESRARELAASAQRLFTDQLLQEVVAGVEQTRADLHASGRSAPIGIVYGGGCALSVVSNGRLRSAIDLPFIIPPFAHDASQFLGAAMHAAMRIGADVTPGQGWPGLPTHSGGHARASQLREIGIPHVPADIDQVARRIVSNELIALVEGAAEAGPRALGQRSILANPRDEFMQRRINSEVKHREWYRPFAPAMPREEFTSYFGSAGSAAAAYMLDAYTFRSEHRPAFRSVSTPAGHARPQAVDRGMSPRFHDLLTAIGRETGHPVVLNTSLNAPCKPIAYDLVQVLDDCYELGLDAAVIDGMLVERDAIAAFATSVRTP